MIDSIADASGAMPDLKRTRRRASSRNAIRIDRLPPSSPEAEAGAIGCCLLSPKDCVGQLVEKFKAGKEAFFDLRLQTIWEKLVEMYDKNDPIDVITLQQKLKDAQLLEQVGGISYLSLLQDAVPSAANLSYYADIVLEKYLLRKMISTCTDVVGRVYDFEGEVETLLDEVERDILQINESRVQVNTKPIKTLVGSAIDTVEKYFQRQGAIGGLATGFVDFDKMTDGLHPGEMIIIAGRTSTGKCIAFDTRILDKDGQIITAEQLYFRKQAQILTLGNNFKIHSTSPSEYIDDGVRSVWKIRTALGKEIEVTQEHPFLTVDGWQPLSKLVIGNHVAVPRCVPVFGVQTVRECEIKIAAYLIGDGSMISGNAIFTKTNPSVRADFSSAIADFGGAIARWHEPHGRAPYCRIVRDKDDVKKHRHAIASMLTEKLSNRGAMRQLAIKIGASPATVVYWRDGISMPSHRFVGAICDALSINQNDMFCYSRTKQGHTHITQWMTANGLRGKRAKDKSVPSFVFTLPRKQMALFINRLFSTDGWASVGKSNREIGYGTTSEKLACEIQHLLLRFGIVAAINKKNGTYKDKPYKSWSVTISDAVSLLKFIDEIGIFGKEHSVDKVKNAVNSRRQKTNVDLIPVQIWQRIAAIKGEESWASLARRAGINSSNIHVGKRSLSRGRLKQFAIALNSVELVELADSDVFWDRITSIEHSGKKQVYDLVIPETHNFIAGDMCVHNTSIAMNVVEHVVLNLKQPVGVFSLEMTSESLVLRMLCSNARVNLRNIRDGFMSEADFPKLSSAAGRLNNAPLYIDDSCGLSILQLRAKARRMWQQHGIKLFVIDYLQMLSGVESRSKENRQQEVSEISLGIKSLAKELGVPVIVLSQMNRDIENDKKRKPRLSDLRESGSQENDADVVGLLYKPEGDDDEDSQPNEQDGVPVNLLIAKSRNGPAGCDVNLTFLKSITRFESAARVSDADLPN